MDGDLGNVLANQLWGPKPWYPVNRNRRKKGFKHEYLDLTSSEMNYKDLTNVNLKKPSIFTNKSCLSRDI